MSGKAGKDEEGSGATAASKSLDAADIALLKSYVSHLASN
jgi:hypothetical protein